MSEAPFASASFGEQDAGSGPVTASPSLGPMTGAIHNISVRHLHDISVSVPDDRQFLRSWRHNLQDCLRQHNGRIAQFLLADVSGSDAVADVKRRCTEVLNKYSNPMWNFASSTRDLSLPTSTADAAAAIEQELGVAPAALRDQMRKAIRLYASTAASLATAEMRLEDKLKRLETLVGRVNDLMFLEPSADLENMIEPTRAYLDSVLGKISIEEEYRALIDAHRRFAVLKPIVALSTFQKQAAPTCTICMTKEVGYVVTPCGHTFCEDCCKTQMTSCFICRVQIRDKVRLYFG